MIRFKYTSQHIEFLKSGYLSMKIQDLTIAFNKKFKTDKTQTAIKSAITNHQITCGRQGKDRLMTHKRLFTKEQDLFVRTQYKQFSAAQTADLVNKRFNLQVTQGQIKAYASRYGILSGRTGRFAKGHKSWNKNTKGLTSANKTSFQKGCVPPNIKPLGHERICPKDGFILIKILEKNPYTGSPTRYKHKHKHIWEQVNGPIPDGMVVAFKDSDKTNCEIDNLMLISRAQLLNLNQHKYKKMPSDLKPTVLALSNLQMAINEKEKFRDGN